jgi:hypothetical protein
MRSSSKHKQQRDFLRCQGLEAERSRKRASCDQEIKFVIPQTKRPPASLHEIVCRLLWNHLVHLRPPGRKSCSTDMIQHVRDAKYLQICPADYL